MVKWLAEWERMFNLPIPKYTDVPYKGTVQEVIYQLIGGLRSGMGYCGAADWKSCQRSGKRHTGRQWCVYRHKFKIHSVCFSFFFARLDK